jgi:hypothetical protein
MSDASLPHCKTCGEVEYACVCLGLNDPVRMFHMQERIDDLEDALQRIINWSEAYPLAVFPKPDLKKARDLLEAGGITLDAVASHCMRHVITGAAKIAREALNAD